MKFYYVRHGHPTYKPDQLTALGKRQAEAVGKRLAMLGIDRIFASTSNRAIETALPLSEMTGLKIELVDFANEIHAAQIFRKDYGTGNKVWAHEVPEIQRKFAELQIKTNDKWYEHPDMIGYGFKEGVERVQRETDMFFEALGYKHVREKGYYEPISATEEKIAFFAHAGFGQMFMSSILDIPYPIFANQFSMRFTGMTQLDFDVKSGICIPRVKLYSGEGHLYKEGVPEAIKSL